MKIKPLTVVETPYYLRQIFGIWMDDERTEFLDFMARNPEAGDLIPETGGVRKVRWRRPGSGKRGGVRVIYFFYHADAPLYLLMAYTKARRENLSPAEKRMVREITAALKQAHRPR